MAGGKGLALLALLLLSNTTQHVNAAKKAAPLKRLFKLDLSVKPKRTP